MVRRTFDQIYDGRHTGRYRLDQLNKTEKTHIGSLIELNLRREFDDLFRDGDLLDFNVDDVDIDCKFSIKFGSWRVPPEAVGKLLLLCTANDDEKSEWSVGIVRATESRLNSSGNRDAKRKLRSASRGEIVWVFDGKDLSENTLLHLDGDNADRILSQRSGQQRINELFRSVTNCSIGRGRGTIATVAQQDDYMKRVRGAGGTRSHLAREGFLIIGGTYAAHRSVARNLGAAVPDRSETISVQVVPAETASRAAVYLQGGWWGLAEAYETPVNPAPQLPKIGTGTSRQTLNAAHRGETT